MGYGATGPNPDSHPTALLGWSHTVSYKTEGYESEKAVFLANEPEEIEGTQVNLFDCYFSEIGLENCEL